MSSLYTSSYLYVAVAMAFLAVSAFYAMEAFGSADAAFWSRTIKSALAGFAAAAFAWTGLGIFRDAAISEREYEKSVRRYAFDMDRASWVVETILQMNSNEQTTVPDFWLQSVCGSLFESPNDDRHENSALESFAALFDATAKA